jgi:hypothetical protein
MAERCRQGKVNLNERKASAARKSLQMQPAEEANEAFLQHAGSNAPCGEP